MDINEIRQHNLRTLIGPDQERGRIAEFAKNNSMDPSYLSQLINGHRKIGEKSARNIEEKTGLQPGELDRPLSNEVAQRAANYLAANIGQDAIELLTKFNKASPEIREAALRMLGITPSHHNQKPEKKSP